MKKKCDVSLQLFELPSFMMSLKKYTFLFWLQKGDSFPQWDGNK